MPVYLAHGFRWPRDGFTGIRVHAIIHNLEPVSVEYIQNPHSRQSLLTSLRDLFPDIMNRLEVSGQRVDFLEQYDPDDTSPTAVTQPYAFVCDRIAMIAGGERAEDHLNDLFQTQAAQAAKEARQQSSDSAPQRTSPERSKSPTTAKKPRAKTQPMSIEKPFNSPPDIRALSANLHNITTDNPIKPDAWDALAELRDKLAKEETIGWWVVYNGDPERAYDSTDDEEEDDDQDEDQTEVGDSQSEGVKELRPKVSSTPVSPNEPRSLPLRQQNRLSAEEKEVLAGPVKQHASKTNAARPAVKSPTGGRVPPPVPPPSRSARSSRHGGSLNALKVDGRDKELPKPPAPTPTTGEFQRAGTATSAMNAQVEEDPSRALAREKDGPKKESLRKKFFSKKGSTG
jgi:hypothetical protein